MSYAAAFDNNLAHRENVHFLAALLLSVALHVLALMALHPFTFDTEKPPTSLEVALAPPPQPPKPPEPPKPQEPPPKPTPVPKRVPLEPVKRAPTPEPVVHEPPPVVEQAPPPVISVPQKATPEPPAFTAPPPPPEPPKPVVNHVDIDAARSLYGNQLTREFARHKQYPRLAQMRGWQGTVQVQVQVDASGALISSSISQSSGFEILDKQALEMVKKAIPLPQPPEALRDRELTMLVPIVFKLE